jgi:hypothetical protein
MPASVFCWATAGYRIKLPCIQPAPANANERPVD